MLIGNYFRPATKSVLSLMKETPMPSLPMYAEGSRFSVYKGCSEISCSPERKTACVMPAPCILISIDAWSSVFWWMG